MANYVILRGALPGAAGATITFVPAGWVADPADHELFPPSPVQVTVAADGTFATPSPGLLETATGQGGWTWTATITGIKDVTAYSFAFALLYVNGATQYLDTLATVPAVAPTATYMPLPAGTPQAGYVPAATGVGEASAWAALPAVPAGLTKVADAGNSGVALINGTQTFCSYTTPSDGNLHPVVVFFDLVVTSGQAGGATGLTFTDASGTLRANFQILAANQAAGLHVWGFNNFLAAPGTSFAVVQVSAQTGGASVAYVQVFAA